METAAISYRVADFLKKYPPFNAMDEQDLLALAARGRVRFYEPNEYILWQGEPHRAHIFVVQQGTVSIWDETGEMVGLRDVRGAGDMLGIERYDGARSTMYSARSERDVVVYGFPAEEFEDLLEKYPRARQYVAAEGTVALDYQATGERRDPSKMFLHELVGHRASARCGANTTIRDAARLLHAGKAEVLAVVDDQHRPLSLLTSGAFVDWLANGGADPDALVGTLAPAAPVVVSPHATATDGLLAMAPSDAPALAITDSGSAEGHLQSVVSTQDLHAAFGDRPVTLLRDIRTATSTQALRDANHLVRAFTLRHLTSAASVDWLAPFTSLADAAIVRRLIELIDDGSVQACWAFSGSPGRAESLTRLAPQLTLILDDGQDRARALAVYRRVVGMLGECDYLPRPAQTFDEEFFVATVSAWLTRFSRWIESPVVEQMYLARRLFDLRPVHGLTPLWTRIETLVADRVDADFLQIIANDCLATLPPLTFFEDAVVDTSGEQTAVFHLEETAMRPLVDVGRVFGLAARQAVGRSTIERFATARALLPEQQALFREAADTFRIVLWQQGRIGISEGTSGIDLPPSLLSRHDRHILKSGFRSILRLLQFTANPEWIAKL